MSDVKRYNLEAFGLYGQDMRMKPDRYGDYVMHKDYELIERENETLREQNFAMNKTIAELHESLNVISKANYASPERLREMAAEQYKG